MTGELQRPLAVDELCSTAEPNDKEELMGPGPWVDEPDLWRGTDATTALPCVAARNRVGVWCGYVGVDKDHPWHGVDRSDDRVHVMVHGGLTFSDYRDEGGPWWFGFDCGHGYDYAPAFEWGMRRIGYPSPFGLHPQEYRTLRYAQVNCALLAYQLGRESRNPPPEDAVDPIFLALAEIIPRKELEA